MVCCQKVNYTTDWGFLLTIIVCFDPGDPLEFALNAPLSRASLDFNLVKDVSMQHNRRLHAARPSCSMSSRRPPA